MMRKLTVAIDGPAGAGKSSVAKVLAKRVHYLYIDTGAMYRAFTWAVLEKGIDIADDKAVRTAPDLMADGFRREFVLGSVDGEIPSKTFGEVFENSAQLVLPCDAGHPQGDHDVSRFAFHNIGNYIIVERLVVSRKMMLFCEERDCIRGGDNAIICGKRRLRT